MFKILVAAIFLFLSACSHIKKEKLENKPNVILISIDSLRSDHVGCMGYSRNVTPQIDKICNEGIRFKNFFSTSYITPISEASVHTGLYPFQNGMISFSHLIHDELETMAEIFKKNGYATLAIGNSPEYNWNAPGVSFQRGFDEYKINFNYKNILDLSLLKEKVSKNKSGQFIWIPLGNAHAPYKPIEGYPFVDPAYQGPFLNYSFWGNAHYYYNNKLYKPNPKSELVYAGKQKEKKAIDQLSVNFSNKSVIKTSKQDMQHIINLYDQSILQADSEVGRIVEILKENNVYDNSIIIIQTEHGEDFNEHKYIAHYDIYDTTTHVPLIFKPHSNQATGRDTEDLTLASGVDILPSLVNYLKLTSRAQFSGRKDLFAEDQLAQESTEVYISRTPVWETSLEFKGSDFYDQLRYENQNGIYTDFGVRNKKWKVIHRRSRLIMSKFSYWQFLSGEKYDAPIFEIYNLENDPTEQKNISDWNSETQALKDKLLKWEKSMFQQTKIGKKIYELQEYR